MRLVSRYKKLTLWKKLAVWAAIATILGLVYNGSKDLANILSNVLFPEKTNVLLQARIEFENIYFSNFDAFQVYDSKRSFEDGWPEKLSDLGKFRFFGLHPHVWLRIFNDSRHPTTVRYVTGYLQLGDYRSKLHTWHRYDYSNEFKDKKSFPLFLDSQQEKIVILPFTWPISETLKNVFPQLTPDSMYTAPHLVNAYLKSIGVSVFGHPAGYEHDLRNIFIQDLTEQVGADSSVTGRIVLSVVLATGEHFTTTITLP